MQRFMGLYDDDKSHHGQDYPIVFNAVLALQRRQMTTRDICLGALIT